MFSYLISKFLGSYYMPGPGLTRVNKVDTVPVLIELQSWSKKEMLQVHLNPRLCIKTFPFFVYYAKVHM
jgi:hypothetical protein